MNDENLFLTNSGNWSETHDLEEKSAKTIKGNKAKKVKFDFFYFIILCVIAIAVFGALQGKWHNRLPIVLIAIGIGAYRYLRNETGNAYKIPISKIIKIDIIGNDASITFCNATDLEDSETIQNIESRGIAILENVKFEFL